ncbi:hypothetical protein HpBTM60_37730 [Helicobacter pylori]
MTKPTINEIITIGELKPKLPALLKAYNIRPNPNVEQTTDVLSNSLCFVVLLLSTKMIPIINAIIAIVATTIKGALQLNVSIKNPVSVGPIAGADCATIPVRPIAKPRFSEGNKVNTVNCINGSNKPAPIA